MIELAFGVFANFKNYGVQEALHPTYGAMLDGKIRTFVAVIGMIENLLYLLEANAAFRIAPEAFAFSRIEMEAHEV